MKRERRRNDSRPLPIRVCCVVAVRELPAHEPALHRDISLQLASRCRKKRGKGSVLAYRDQRERRAVASPVLLPLEILPRCEKTSKKDRLTSSLSIFQIFQDPFQRAPRSPSTLRTTASLPLLLRLQLRPSRPFLRDLPALPTLKKEVRSE